MAAPTRAVRQFAADTRATFTALVDEGFTEDQALAIVCQLLRPAPPTSDKRSNTAAVAEALLSGKKPPATRSPVDDRTAHLWNPSAPQGAPAHE